MGFIYSMMRERLLCLRLQRGHSPNTQCTMNGFDVSTSGNNLTLNLSLIANLGLSGTEYVIPRQNVYLQATGKTATSGWVLDGSWTPYPTGPPGAGPVEPTSGTGLTQTFTMSYVDADG